MGDRKRPNFLIIIADDLGFSDIGCFGSEIPTPNLDKLAQDGIRMTGFHTASACSPTRSMLFSGTDHHLAGLGQMAEAVGMNLEAYGGKPGYEGVLNQRVAALSEVLVAGGYETLMSGKWHLGLTPESRPNARGFEKVFTLLSGAANHYCFEPYLENGQIAMKLGNPLYYENERSVPLDELRSENFYSTTYYTDKMLEYLSERDTSRPFFAYLPYTAPHWPVQAPQDRIAKYKGWYDHGPEALRERRLASLIKLGLVQPGVELGPLVDAYGLKRWNDMSKEEKALEARKMEVYAAMIEVMDEEIGRVIDHLQKTGDLDNTFVFFASDNGAEGALLEAVPVMGASIHKAIEQFFDNSLDNLGNGNSYHCIGPAWAQAATAPNRMYKAWNTEGGVRCPAVLRYPALDVQRSIEHSINTVMDVMPTLLDLAGIEHPGSHFNGRKVLPMRGKSWLPRLEGKMDEFHEKDEIFGWELFGQAAIRRGKWKALWIPAPGGPEKWQLFDVEADAGELHDLAEQEPKILAEMIDHWTIYEAETGTVMIEPGSANYPTGFGFWNGM